MSDITDPNTFCADLAREMLDPKLQPMDRQAVIFGYAATLESMLAAARVEERQVIRKLWDKLGIILGASAGSATGATTRNDFGEDFDFQLDRDALNEFLKRLNRKEP